MFIFRFIYDILYNNIFVIMKTMKLDLLVHIENIRFLRKEAFDKTKAMVMIMKDTVNLFVIGYDRRFLRALRRRSNGKIFIFGDGRRHLFSLGATNVKLTFDIPDIVAMYINLFAEQSSDKLTIITATKEYEELLSAIEPLTEARCIIVKEKDFERCKALSNS